MPKAVTIYVKPTCPFCISAIDLLRTLGVEPEVHDVSNNLELRKAVSESVGGWPTVPMIFLGEEFVGGYTDLRALHEQGRLTAKLS
ncbi:glutaredoxin [Isosphaera pallida ATCC 43644]|uniref:Glutaredoxin n=1 Tax=Isosphaera pallida (strain ATCC 43644 / DSM 9630 / IS1B) TaxID=575540 RepID=E8R4Z3_ISOPI|nr:glutaredoxin [Isosphaera pallida]ADV62750.1 glutaredoxin [Isosphaera pallida ATCC 43644]